MKQKRQIKNLLKARRNIDYEIYKDMKKVQIKLNR